MDRETIIKLAREAGLISSEYNGFDATELTKAQINFAKLVRDDYSFTHAQLWIKRINDAVAAEREACAKVCEEVERKATQQPPMVGQGCQACAAAIRERSANAGARGNT